MVSAEVSLKEKYVAYEREKIISKIERNAASSRSLTENSVAAFKILVTKYRGYFPEIEDL